ncbi:hypothetical protein LTR10_009715 [Elasticomyces elasticus]|nr:hypothetical protein LTR10_009715 [Elasticomyces elasticus]KAK4970004.1 hypothetical protein LTR42_008171 [Elasticomyces elasticus]
MSTNAAGSALVLAALAPQNPSQPVITNTSASTNNVLTAAVAANGTPSAVFSPTKRDKQVSWSTRILNVSAGTWLAVGSVAGATVIGVYYGQPMLRLAIWTARNEFRGSCIEDRSRGLASAACNTTLLEPARPPPFRRRSIQPASILRYHDSAVLVAVTITAGVVLVVVTLIWFRGYMETRPSEPYRKYLSFEQKFQMYWHGSDSNDDAMKVPRLQYETDADTDEATNTFESDQHATMMPGLDFIENLTGAVRENDDPHAVSSEGGRRHGQPASGLRHRRLTYWTRDHEELSHIYENGRSYLKDGVLSSPSSLGASNPPATEGSALSRLRAWWKRGRLTAWSGVRNG